jgi:hypothetical protein
VDPALPDHPTLTVAKAIEMLEAAGGNEALVGVLSRPGPKKNNPERNCARG